MGLQYVRKATGAPKVHWVGHSQGGAQLIQALALEPSLKEQLSTIALLAPALNVAHMNVPLLTGLAHSHMDQIWHSTGIDIPGIETHNKYFPGPSFSHIVEYFTGHSQGGAQLIQALALDPSLNYALCAACQD